MATEPEDRLHLVSTVIGEKYAIERVLRADDFNIQYSGTQLIVNRPVVIRVLAGLANVERHERARLYNGFLADQARLAELLAKAPALRHIRDAGTLPSSGGDWLPFAVEDGAQGKPLSAILSERRRAGTTYTLADAVMALDPIAVALAVAHDAGLAHGRVSPDDIWVLETGMVLCNFGFAHLAARSRELAEIPVDVAGPPNLSPPRSDRHGGTPRGDVFALATLLMEMSGKTRPLANLKADAVLARALGVPPARSWRTAGEFWRPLRDALGLSPLRSLTKTIPPEVLPDARSQPILNRTRFLILSATLILVGVAVGVLWSTCAPEAPRHGLGREVQGRLTNAVHV